MKASAVTNALRTLVSAHQPVFVWGSPGAGKSSIVAQLARCLNLSLRDIRALLFDLRAQLAKVDFDQAMTVALLASVSSELSVSEYNSAKAERLEALAKSFRVDTAAVRKQSRRKSQPKRTGGSQAVTRRNRPCSGSVTQRVL